MCHRRYRYGTEHGKNVHTKGKHSPNSARKKNILFDFICFSLCSLLLLLFAVEYFVSFSSFSSSILHLFWLSEHYKNIQFVHVYILSNEWANQYEIERKICATCWTHIFMWAVSEWTLAFALSLAIISDPQIYLFHNINANEWISKFNNESTHTNDWPHQNGGWTWSEYWLSTAGMCVCVCKSLCESIEMAYRWQILDAHCCSGSLAFSAIEVTFIAL